MVPCQTCQRCNELPIGITATTGKRLKLTRRAPVNGTHRGALPRRSSVIWLVVIALVSACAAPPRDPVFASVALPPLAADKARIFFYRFYEPYESLARHWIYLNRRETLVSIPGAVSMRDVAPGAYEIYVYSKPIYPNQFKHVVLHAGDTLHVRVDVSRSWWTTLRYEWETFVATLVAPEQARVEMADLRYSDGNSP
jgi:hypothetical protein